MTESSFALRGHIKTLRYSGRNDGMVEDMEKAANALDHIEKVSPVAYNPACVMLLNAMAALAGDKGDIAEIFALEFKKGEQCLVDVQLIVNGVSVPFTAAVTFAWESLNKKINKKVEERALELLNGSGLIDLKNAIDDAQWKIEDALRKALEDKQ